MPTTRPALCRRPDTASFSSASARRTRSPRAFATAADRWRTHRARSSMRLGGSGGLVAVGRDGELALPFNCSGMYRGYVEADGIAYTAIYDEGYRST